jgi:hypothetical protein
MGGPGHLLEAADQWQPELGYTLRNDNYSSSNFNNWIVLSKCSSKIFCHCFIYSPPAFSGAKIMAGRLTNFYPINGFKEKYILAQKAANLAWLF